MFIPPKMQFYCNSKCDLNCEFCVKQNSSLNVDMNMSTFKKYVDKCIDFGIDTFELTPIVGETLLDKNLIKRIEYLAPHAKRILAFTNLMSLEEDILSELDRFPNFYLYLSIYGNTPKVIEQRTGVSWEKYTHMLYESYAMLAFHVMKRKTRGFNIGEITYRFKFDPDKPITKNNIHHITKLLIATKKCEAFYVFSEDYNWKELFKVEETLDDDYTTRDGIKGVCRNFLNDIGIWPSGDIGICSGWFDVNKRMILGNLNDNTLAEIFSEDSLFNTLLNEQREGKYRSLCKYCTYLSKNKNPYGE